MALFRKRTAGVMLLAAALLGILFSAAAVHSYTKRHRPARYNTYIVLLWPTRDADAMDKDAHRRWHQSFLPPGNMTDSGEPRLLRSYTNVFNGFAARLTDAELEAVTKKPGFLRWFPERTRHYLEHWHQGRRHKRLKCPRKAAGRRCRGSSSSRG